MTKQNKSDNRKQLLIRFEIDDKRRISFINPCCEDIPFALFTKVMKAITKVEEEWNEAINKKEIER